MENSTVAIVLILNALFFVGMVLVGYVQFKLGKK